jgi:hypothetical protein
VPSFTRYNKNPRSSANLNSRNVFIIFQVPLAQYFPEYTGGTDANQGVEYILLRFIQLNRAPKNVHAQ